MGKRVGGKMGEEMQAVWMGGWVNSGGITGTNGLAGQGTGQQASGCLDGGWATDREQVRGVLAPSVLLPASLGNPEQGPRLPCRQRPGESRTAVNSVQSPGRVSGWLTFTAQRSHLLPSDHGPEAPAL